MPESLLMLLLIFFSSHLLFNDINSNLKGFEPVLDESGKMIGYKTDLGVAGTVFPFSSGSGRLYLYKDGDQCEELTGGWVNYNNSSCTFNESNISVVGRDGASYIQAQKAITQDMFNEYSVIVMELSYYGGGNMYLYDTAIPISEKNDGTYITAAAILSGQKPMINTSWGGTGIITSVYLAKV